MNHETQDQSKYKDTLKGSIKSTCLLIPNSDDKSVAFLKKLKQAFILGIFVENGVFLNISLT